MDTNHANYDKIDIKKNPKFQQNSNTINELI